MCFSKSTRPVCVLSRFLHHRAQIARTPYQDAWQHTPGPCPQSYDLCHRLVQPSMVWRRRTTRMLNTLDGALPSELGVATAQQLEPGDSLAYTRAGTGCSNS